MKSAFIVRDTDNTVKVITEGILVRDIKAKYNEIYPGNKVKSKLFERMAAEAIQQLNGVSATSEEYNSSLKECATIIERYLNTTLIEFGSMMNKAQAFDKAVEVQQHNQENNDSETQQYT